MKRIAKELERQNKTKEFITAFIAKEGFPIWSKARIERHKQKSNTASFNPEGLEDTTVYIPLVVSADEYVTGFLKATVDDSVDINIFRQSDYINFPFKTPTSSNNVTTAEQYAIRFMSIDKDVFGSTEFKIEDKRMFNNSTDYSDTANFQRFVKLTSLSGEDGFADGTTINNYQWEVCWSVETVFLMPCGDGFSGSGNNNTVARRCWYIGYTSVCTTYENGGGGGENNPTGTWPFPPGSGGGNGGSSNVPCIEFGASITNSFVPIECTPTEGNQWPPQTPQSWLDNIWMTYNFKDSTNNPCVESVLNTLRSMGTKLPELLRSVFDTSGTNGFEVTLKLEDLGLYGGGGSTTRNISNFEYKSKINSYFMDATDLSVATTIIHEIFHCQLFAWYRKAFLLNDTALRNNLVRKYGYIFTNEYTNLDSNFIAIVAGPDVLAHQDIAVRYRDIIGEALYQFALAKSINVTLDYCKDLAWSGCQESRAFAEYPSGQGRIDERIKAEKDPYGTTLNDPWISPKGHPCL